MKRSFRRADGVYEPALFRRQRLLVQLVEIVSGFMFAVALAAAFALKLALGALLAGAIGAFLFARLLHRLRADDHDGKAAIVIQLRVVRPSQRLECIPGGKLEDPS